MFKENMGHFIFEAFALGHNQILWMKVFLWTILWRWWRRNMIGTIMKAQKAAPRSNMSRE